MANAQTSRFVTLLIREFREYKISFLWTPVVIAMVLGMLMLGSVVLANRISVFNGVLVQSVVENRSGVNISTVQRTDEVTLARDRLSAEWKLPRGGRNDSGDADGRAGVDQKWAREMGALGLNPVLNALNGIFILVLMLTTFRYLLGSLHSDRRDLSILFWRSMPVSEWDVVLSKYVTAMLVVPLLYIAISTLLQLAYLLFVMMLLWRMGEHPLEIVAGNIDIFALLGNPLGGWALTALWIAPLYAYLLLASSAARRSPFVMAIVPPLALMFAEGLFFGSEWVRTAVQNHIPHLGNDSAVGFYLFGPNFSDINLLSMASGLVFTALALTAAVFLRRHRWEL